MFMDPIADLLTKIRNASQARLNDVKIQTSNLTTNIVKVLKDEGYILDYTIKAVGKSDKKNVTYIKLKYVNNIPSINGIKQISKPGLRVYSNADKIPYVLNGLGIAILSTNLGVVTDKKARTQKVGGEVIAYVW